MGNLQRHMDLYQAKEETFIAYRDMLIDYLNRFIRQLVISTSAVSTLILDLKDGVPMLLQAAAEREFQDVFNKSDAELEKLKRRQNKRWQGLAGWFVGGVGRKSQAEVLRHRALAAIPDLLSVVEAMNERKANRGDRTADLRTLARWFMECDHDRDAHRLWRAAFGLHPSRHLLINGDTLERWDRESNSSRMSWLDGPKLAISPRLRRYGSARKRGRPTPIIDRAEERRRLSLMAAEQAEQLNRARARLARDKRLLISQLDVLDPLAFDLFFDLLTRALSQKTYNRDEVRVFSSDGTMEIQLEPFQPAMVALVHTLEGNLLVPEHYIRIRDLFPVAIKELV